MYINHTLRLSVLSLTIFSLLPATTVFASANMLITPATGHTLPTSISSGQTVSAFYTVINNTHSTRSGYKVQGLPNSVKQNTSGTMSCTNPITLAALGSCTLQLDISSAVHSNFAICKGTNCTTAEVPLNVSQNATPAISRVTVGSYITTNFAILPLIYTSTNAGASWTLNTTPLQYPANAAINSLRGPSSMNIKLSDVSCDRSSTHQCTAVGVYTTQDNDKAPLAYTSSDAGKSWTLSTGLTIPADAAPGDNAAMLNRASCDSTGLKCVAVGSYNNNSGAIVPLVYTSTNGGKSWTLNPTNLPLPPQIGNQATLNGVYCNDAGQKCTAVGVYEDVISGNVPLAYTSTTGGQSWTLNTVPLPSNISTLKPFAQLSQVACNGSTGTVCTAVGIYTSDTEESTPLAYTTTDGGNTWVNTQVPAPTNLPNSGVNLQSVSCDETGAKCLATATLTTRVNFAPTPSFTYPPIIYTSSNGGHSWTESKSVPTKKDTIYMLNSVVCDKATGLQCSAVGSTLSQQSSLGAGFGMYPSLLKSSDGGISWSIVTVSVPKDFALIINALRTRQQQSIFSGLNGVQ